MNNIIHFYVYHPNFLYFFLATAVDFFTLLRTKEKNKHRGEILQAVVQRSSISITQLTKRMGISRGTFYNHVQEAELPFEMIERYGRILKYDFTADFPQMHKYIVEEPIEHYGIPANYDEALRQAEYYKERYFLLLEKYTALIEEKLEKK